MNKRVNAILLLLGVVAVLGCSRSAATATESSVSTKRLFSMVVTQAHPGSTVLKISLKNTAGKDLTMDRDSLPWRKRYSMRVIVTPVDEEEPLKPVYMIDDTAIGQITLAPNKIEEGELDLSYRYPALAEMLRHKGALVFWTYRLSSREGSDRAFGGCELAPAQ